ncbi:hypothetical protein AB6A40_002916 [Gnathostoma spinigerum]|uniref:Uncharacterized protein n=1 Tax=Gnathostoma spinigerum TaxID=75299 RepID=A0ABD6EI11_9BILA
MLVERDVITTEVGLKNIGLPDSLLHNYKAVGVVYEEICGEHSRELWFANTDDARALGIDATSPICEPYKEELNPNEKKLAELARTLNDVIYNYTIEHPGIIENKGNKDGTLLEIQGTFTANSNSLERDKRSVDGFVLKGISDIQRAKRKIVEVPPVETFSENLWTEDLAESSNHHETPRDIVIFKSSDENSAANATIPWLVIQTSEVGGTTMEVPSVAVAHALSLNISEASFKRHQKVVLYLPGICADYVPSAVDEFNASEFKGVQIEGPIGLNITALELAGVNLTELAERLRNDTEVDDILRISDFSARTLGGSYILPVLQKNHYDPFSAPIVFQGSAVVVRFGMYIESISNFQTSTMNARVPRSEPITMSEQMHRM